MGPEIISYIALGIILIIGSFIVIQSFKFKWGKFPLLADEKLIYEEEKVKFKIEFGNSTDIYRPQPVKITNKRIFVFKKYPYISLVFDFTNKPSGNTDQLKGIIYIPKSELKIVMDEKTHQYVLECRALNILSIQSTYTIYFNDINKVKSALQL